MALGRRSTFASMAFAALASFALTACGGGGDGGPGPEGPPGPPGPDAPPPPLEKFDPLPGVNLEILSVTGGSGAGGNVLPGDTLTVQFTVKDDTGADLDLSTFTSGQIYLSGPTQNYQRVIRAQTNVVAASVFVGGGVWQYTFAVPVPAVYDVPYNDTTAFGSIDGEWAGQSLVDGTYTIGLQAYETYSIESVDYRDAGAATFDVRLGGATTVTPREAVLVENCNECHDEIRAHGGSRVGNVTLCLLCHTSGSEDRNDNTSTPAFENWTPGVSVDFKVMIHQIHNAKHLPSVLGVATNADGSRNYAAAPRPLEYVGFNNTFIDLSAIGWPLMPSAYTAYLYNTSGDTNPANYLRAEGNGPMPRDLGFGALPPASKLKEDQMRAGAVSCDKCHGGASQGDLYKTQPSRMACGSCHDDIDWTLPYSSNGSSMPPQADNNWCLVCHTPDGPSLPTSVVHRHPYDEPTLNTGINLHVLGLAAGSGAGGRHLLGDRLQVTFDVKNDAGADVPLHQTARGQSIVIGPTANPQPLAANMTLFDSGFRKSSPFTGAGTVTGLSITSAASVRVYAVVFTATNIFDVVTYDRATNTFATLLSAQVVPAGGSLPVSLPGISFTVNDTGTDFAAGDRFYMEVLPPASSYTQFLPSDVALENLGAVPGAFPAALTLGNAPMTWGRQVVNEAATTGPVGNIAAPTAYLGRYVVLDAAVNAGLARRDYVVIDYGLATEEFVRIGRIQTTDDATGADLGAADRFWFATSLRFPHAAGATVQEVTLTARREGVEYLVTNPSTGAIQLLLAPGAWSSTSNRVVVNYRTDLRFGRYRYFGDTLQNVVPDAPADSDDVGQEWGDWKGLSFLDGTYTIGFWINRDYTVSGNNPTSPSGESTGYRMISPPATWDLVFGAGAPSATPVPRPQIADPDACNACHGDLVAHGNGRRGLETCLMCHSVPGFEDGVRYTIGSGTNPDFDAYVPSFVPASPGVTMDFRQLLHKVHMGRELTNGASYKVVGVFLGVPYGVTYADVGFPVFAGEARNCEKCHGAGTSAWKEPAPRVHPGATTATRTWRAVCSSCHDSTAAAAHIDVSTPGGVESCDVCHGPGKPEAIENVHISR